ncbi:DNA repair photolyase [Mobilisporobacter senegalensis]|jgi:DNA repair photolyase|uniref:DNA repair photolyase n=1 Tax=Mobilisporobacter senegalensis TaxID=1329262 RepID=A0A3N1XPV3_9FIRM|nr:radical SAM protein [Mobilisporobacter senegalensis]ROR28646.1 DNA repair photolyase [Mobilisporobacter senegalensis]
MNIDLIVEEIKREPEVKTCKNLLKKKMGIDFTSDDFKQVLDILKSEDEYVRVFAVMYMALAYEKLESCRVIIHERFVELTNDWSKKFIRYGLIPSIESILEKGDLELIKYIKNKLADPEYPVLARIYLETYSKVLAKKDNKEEVVDFLDSIVIFIVSNNMDTQQGLVTSINNLGKKNIILLQKYIMEWIEIKNVNAFYVVRKVFELKFGELIEIEFKKACEEKMNKYEIERIQLISEKFNDDKSKTEVTYQEIVVSTMLHFINSPMLPFNWGANPYRGCLHACEYCYGRTSHEYLGHTKDEFERIIYVKINADKALEKQIMVPKWRESRNKLINLGTVTDPYQKIDEHYEITRKILELLYKYKNPVTITTKSDLVMRDIDILTKLGPLTDVVFSIPSLDQSFLDKIEKRAAPIENRLKAIEKLKKAGITVGVLMIPIFPFITDSESEMEHLVKTLSDYKVDYVIPDILNLRGDSKYKVKQFIDEYYPQLTEDYERLYVRGNDNLYVDKEYQKRIFDYLMKGVLKKYGLNDYSKMIKGKWL